VWRLRVGETTTDNYTRCGPSQPQKPPLEQFVHHCLVSQPLTEASTREYLLHDNIKTQCEQQLTTNSNTILKKRHRSDQTPRHSTGTVPPPPATSKTTFKAQSTLK